MLTDTPECSATQSRHPPPPRPVSVGRSGKVAKRWRTLTSVHSEPRGLWALEGGLHSSTWVGWGGHRRDGAGEGEGMGGTNGGGGGTPGIRAAPEPFTLEGAD